MLRGDPRCSCSSWYVFTSLLKKLGFLAEMGYKQNGLYQRYPFINTLHFSSRPNLYPCHHQIRRGERHFMDLCSISLRWLVEVLRRWQSWEVPNPKPRPAVRDCFQPNERNSIHVRLHRDKAEENEGKDL